MNMLEFERMEGKEEGLAEGIAKGMVEGRTEKEISVVRKLLVSTDFSDARIADLAGVSEAFVMEVREGKRK